MQRMNYSTYPTDYINALNASGKRKKSMAFMSYWHDFEQGEHNSIGFYAKAWDCSKSTAHAWTKEFADEIELFLAHWQLRNREHHNAVAKTAERSPNESNGRKARNNGGSKRTAERSKNQVFNSKPIVDEEESKADLNDIGYRQLTTTYSMARGYVKADEAYEHYRRVKQIVPTRLILKAAIDYLNDDAVENKYGLTKFLKNMIFMQYIPEFEDITIHGKQTVHGTYKQHEALFLTEEGKVIPMKMERFVELLSSGSVEFEQRGAA